MNPPIDLLQMKEALGQSNGRHQTIARTPVLEAAAAGIHFADYVLRPRDNRLIGPEGAEVTLSTLETRVLQHLAETPGIVWPPTAIAEAAEADGADADRSVGPVIARLRKKLARLGGAAGQRLIKTESGRGYMLAGEAVPAWPAPMAGRGI